MVTICKMEFDFCLTVTPCLTTSAGSLAVAA